MSLWNRVVSILLSRNMEPDLARSVASMEIARLRSLRGTLSSRYPYGKASGRKGKYSMAAWGRNHGKVYPYGSRRQGYN